MNMKIVSPSNKAVRQGGTLHTAHCTLHKFQKLKDCTLKPRKEIICVYRVLFYVMYTTHLSTC